ncbi:MAG: hypothetical protein LBC21_01480 [Oscillospiraceae bacterium]|jgi:hypothetical protein|nr:hypothetical protein [Oscillospiraceae bacterium]
MTLFGTNRQFDLTRLPFTVAGAFLGIYQKLSDGRLYLSIYRSENVVHERPDLLRLVPVDAVGDELPSIYECDEAKLTVNTKQGSVEFTYDGPQIMRVRTNGVTLRVENEPKMHEGAYSRGSGKEIELAFNFMGKLLFNSISGKMEHNIFWNYAEVRPNPYKIDITGECAIHEYISNGTANDSYPPFDEAYKNTLAKFEEFRSAYPEFPVQYRDMARRAMWNVWHNQLGPRGTLTSSPIYMHKLFMDRAFGWHHGFHAMAMSRDVKRAIDVLLAMFDYANHLGVFPDNLSDQHQETWISTKPPIFGFATCYILEHFDTSELTSDDYRRLYDKLSKYTAYWFAHHDHARTGIPSYYHIDESGYDESTLFNGGLPIQAPDLQAYIVTLCEACSLLAEKLGLADDAERWDTERRRILAFLVEDLWDGEQFLARLPACGGKTYRCGSVAQLQPVMLGHRLPRTIIKKLARRLLDEREYLTDYGIASEHLQSPEFLAGSFTRGPVVAPTQALIILGLFDGGEQDAARSLAARYLNALNTEGLALGIHPFRAEPVTYMPTRREYSGQSVSFPFSAWVASVYLLLSQLFPAP